MWTRKQHEDAAQKIGETFVASGGAQSINSLATKVAQDSRLNPDSIRTMVRLANVVAFESLFNKRADAKHEDRMIDFEVGDPEVVISNLQGAVKEAYARMLPSAYDKTLDYFGSVENPKEPLEKNANAIPEFEPQSVGVEMPVSRLEVRHLFKRAEDRMRQNKLQAQYAWYGQMEKVAQTLRVLDGRVPSRTEFEKTALGTLGDAIIPELKMIRTMTGSKDVEDDFFASEKVASFLGTHVAIPIKEHRPILDMLKTACETRKDIHRYEHGLQWIKTNMPEIR